MADIQPETGFRKNRSVLWILAAVFALPMVCSWILFLHPGLLPERHSNHGSLIRPAVVLPTVVLDRIDDSGFRLEELRGKWTFLMVVDASCSEPCKELVLQLQQIRRATGKDREHVELLMLYKSGPVAGDLSALKGSPGMIVVGFNDPEMDIMESTLNQAGVHERPGLIVVDPMGNMVMHYPRAVTARDILQDLRRLLQATHDWLPGESEKHDEPV